MCGGIPDLVGFAFCVLGRGGVGRRGRVRGWGDGRGAKGGDAFGSMCARWNRHRWRCFCWLLNANGRVATIAVKLPVGRGTRTRQQ